MYIKRLGQGPDCVMVHGWSMHSAVWSQLTQNLAQHFTLHLVDLPGHGQSEWHDGALHRDVLIEALADQLPDQAYWIGWSLGGLIALDFADRFVKRVKKLVLIGATPCFVKSTHWPYAVDPEVLDNFAQNLNINQQETLYRFLQLQARGSKHSRSTIDQLSQQLAIEQPPVLAALYEGLTLLKKMDMRTALSTLSCPVKLILGDRDTLIPHPMLLAAKALQPHIQSTIIANAGHAPFISHATQCTDEIKRFLDNE